MSRQVQAAGGPMVRAAAVAMVKALYGKKDGVLAADLHAAVGPHVQGAAALLREMGVAVVARRARDNSRWWMAPVRSDEYDQMVDRVLWDFYVQCVRGHRMLTRNPLRKQQAKVFQDAAVAAGGELGRPLPTIVNDLKAVPIPGDFATVLRAGGYLVDPTTLKMSKAKASK
jgi:hypothetical protein